MNGFLKGCGIALILGGLLLVLINVILTPRLSIDQDEAVLRTSTAYLVRLSISGVAALLLLFGCTGVHLAQRKDSGSFGVIAFVFAFIGNCLVVAVEWSNVFVLRAVAQVSPDALSALGDSRLMTIGFAASAGLFGLGWLLLAASTLRTGMYSRWVPLTIIVGLVAIPGLGATPLGLTGAIVGTVILGLGIASLGRALTQLG